MPRSILCLLIIRTRKGLPTNRWTDMCKAIYPTSLKFEVIWSKVKVTVTVNILIYRPNLVRMISRHRIDLGSSNLEKTFVFNFEINLSKVKVIVAFSLMIYRLNQMITRHGIDIGSSNWTHTFVLECK